MSRKTVSAVMLFLLVISTLALTFRIQSVKADDGTVYINADGSITPSTAPIYSADNITYTLTGSITSDADGIVIERDNIVLNGAGYAVQGIWGSGSGIDLTGRSNVTIEETVVEGFDYGINLDHSSENYILGNTVENTLMGGIYLISPFPSDYNPTFNNTISENYVTENTWFGIFFDRSGANTLRNNTMTNNGVNIGLYGEENQQFVNDVDSSNTVNGKPVYYWINTRDASVPTDAGVVILVECTNITVTGLDINSNNDAVLLVDTSDSRVINNTIENNQVGIHAWYSPNNIFAENNLNGDNIGIFLYATSSSNAVCYNNITNGYSGFWLFDAEENSIFGNTIAYSSIGIRITDAVNNVIYHNNLLNNMDQILVERGELLFCPNAWDDGYPSGGNYWSDYNGTDLYSGPYQNMTGVDGIEDTPYTIDAHNIDDYPLMNPYISLPLQTSITSVTGQASVGEPLVMDSTLTGGEFPNSYQWFLNGTAVPGAVASSWDFVPTTPGNFTVYLNVTDGLGNIASSNEVSFESHRHDAAVVDVVPQPAWVYEGGRVNVNVTIANNGDVNDQMFVTLFYDITGNGQVANATISLGPAQNTVVTFGWNTTGILPFQNYTLTATVATLHDFNASNNQADSTLQVRIRLPGDINDDGKVDMKDVNIAARAYGSHPGDSNWNPDADVNGDGKIDVRDIALIAKNYGQHYP